MRNRYLDSVDKFFDDSYKYAQKMYEENFVSDDTVETVSVLTEKMERYLEPLKIKYRRWLSLTSNGDFNKYDETGKSVAISPYFFVKKGSNDYAVFNAYLEACSAIMNYYNGRTKYQDDKSKDLEKALNNWYKLTAEPKQNILNFNSFVAFLKGKTM